MDHRKSTPSRRQMTSECESEVDIMESCENVEDPSVGARVKETQKIDDKLEQMGGIRTSRRRMHSENNSDRKSNKRTQQHEQEHAHRKKKHIPVFSDSDSEEEDQAHLSAKKTNTTNNLTSYSSSKLEREPMTERMKVKVHAESATISSDDDNKLPDLGVQVKQSLTKKTFAGKSLDI